MRCAFETRVIDGFTCVVDIGGDNAMSVTNDADDVVDHLVALGMVPSNCLIPYRDSVGLWDGLIVRDGKFYDFYIVCASSAKEVIELWRQKNI